MKVEQKKNQQEGILTILLKDTTPIKDAHILLIAENSTFFEGHTNDKGITQFKSIPLRQYSIFIAHPLYPAFAIDNYTPDKDLEISINKINNEGSIICAMVRDIYQV